MKGFVRLRELRRGLRCFSGESDLRRFALTDCQGRSNVKVHYTERPRRCVIVKKWQSEEHTAIAREMGLWLRSVGVEPLVEPYVRSSELPEFAEWDLSEPHRDVDLVIALGGDGTVLHVSSLFEQDEKLPPLIAFSAGSLGFITPHSVHEYRAILEKVFSAVGKENGIYCTLRKRVDCHLQSGDHTQRYRVLNECVVSRQAPQLLKLNVDVDGLRVTTSEADGLIISSPTGSTAYNLSAGGPMVSPSVQALLLTPVAPHSLSFRPLVIPPKATVRISYPTELSGAAPLANIYFDGGPNTRTFEPGDVLTVTTSDYDMPHINLRRYDGDWFHSIKERLYWNVTKRQTGREGPDSSTILDSDSDADE